MNLVLSPDLRHIIHAHVEGTYPNEGGGFLVGTLSGDQRVVTEVHPVQNVFASEEQFHRFLAEDGTFQRIEDEADTRGLTLVGYFHSHPNSPAVPSEFDRVHAWPHFAYLIVSVQNSHAVETRLWELVDDRSRFNEANLTIKE
ncbi:MAG: M67 family metallopeptidase [Anaerolineales bacterium]|nr:M67 family metallopeptidase [Anaerolineales bacterium]